MITALLLRRTTRASAWAVLLIDLFVLVLPPLRGLVVGTQILAVQNASSHEISPLAMISEIQPRDPEPNRAG